MALVYFVAALLGIVLFALVVNRLTGTRALYLDALALEPSEQEIWRDTTADFASVPTLGRALVMSFPRLRRHTVLWTNRRIVIAQRALFSQRSMVTHQVVLGAGSEAATHFAGGFYGRGFSTIEAAPPTLAVVNGRDCIKLVPSASSSAALNLAEAYIFSDRVAELRSVVEKP